MKSLIDILMKVETHNHQRLSPCGVQRRGAGGEIRDEGATGRGGKPKQVDRLFTYHTYISELAEVGAIRSVEHSGL
jgi:phosphoribosylformylglycinamidine (FGAM) synthase-like enzyme